MYFVKQEYNYLVKFWPKKLKSGIIHCDLFIDNIFFYKKKYYGIIDFYFSANDFLAYELAICVNALCFNKKGIRYLIKAWKKIDYKLIIAGTGPLENFVKSQLNEKIIFLGKQSKEGIRSLMNAASFLVMPSIWYEGFPMVFLEAYSAGLPVLGSRIGSIEEVVLDNITGLHFEPNQSRDIVKKVNTIIKDRELLKKISKNARKEYLEKYTPSKNYDILKNIYNSVIESK